MVLNDQIDLTTAQTYSAISRTVAQMLTAEVQQARFLSTAPDLTFPDDDE